MNFFFAMKVLISVDGGMGGCRGSPFKEMYVVSGIMTQLEEETTNNSRCKCHMEDK